MEIGVKDIGKLMRKSLALILTLTVVSTATAFALSVFVLPKEYSASAMVIVNGNAAVGQKDSLTASEYDLNVRLVNSYRILCMSKRVLEQVISQKALPYTEKQLSDMVSVTAEENTEILTITVISPSPQMAADIANSMTDVFKSEVINVMNMDNVKVIDYAEAPTSPARPDLFLNVVVSILAGLFAGFIIALIRYVLDDTVKQDAQLTDILEIPVIGNIPKIVVTRRG
ncbi:MAG: Wzz/FepE/Etk N-terminal domain-containing protein [Eubacteriales bacterium]